MEYVIVENDNTNDLAVAVNSLITDGWRPLGGVGVASNTYTDRESDVTTVHWYMQAMTREQH